jgi:predicted ATPase/signal transduction histidine kinase
MPGRRRHKAASRTVRSIQITRDTARPRSSPSLIVRETVRSVPGNERSPTGRRRSQTHRDVQRWYKVDSRLAPHQCALGANVTVMSPTNDAEAAAGEEGVVLDSLLGQLEPRLCLSIAAGMAEALAALHAAGLVHHDLEPSQIFVSVATGRAWFARPHGASGSADRGRPRNLAYMAPERSGRSSSGVDGRADLYSLGVCLYELATGTLPFAANEPLEWVHAHMAVRPTPPAQRRAMPTVLERILLKLLEKEPEDRYQAASGLAHDLRDCLLQLTTAGTEPSFPLGRHDDVGRLSRRLDLVGRSHELDALTVALESVRRTGKPELALVSGSSGIGKSSLVSEFDAQRLPQGALFVSAKFEDRESDAPYASLMLPFRELLRWVLARPARELDEWKAALEQALGNNASIVAELVPELAHIVDIHAPAVRLPGIEAKNRIFASFRRILQAFVRKRPVVIFLDDLQWIDGASLGLVEHLLSDPDLGGLLLIGAYREESVTTTHPLSAAVDRLRAGQLSVRQMRLRPLTSPEVERMVANLLLEVPEITRELAHVVERKTGGNPFFVRQFLIALTEEALLHFDARQGTWAWDLPSIEAKCPTENLADLLLERLARLPASTQSVLESLGCFSARARAPVLAEISGITVVDLNERFRVAVRAEVLAETAEGYAFSHDRLQTAAYSRIPESERPTRHLAIGRTLKARSERDGADSLFEVVRQLNRASELLVDATERIQLAELNVKLAQRSRSRAATATALAHLEQALRLMPVEHWQLLPDLSFELALAHAECEFLCGEHERAESQLAELAGRNLDMNQRGALVCIQLDLFSASYRWAQAIDVGVGYLQSAGAPWQTFDLDELTAEYQRLKRALGNRLVASLADAPALNSTTVRTTMEICVRLLGPVAQTNQRLFALVLLHVVSLSIEQGSCDLSVPAYANISNVLGPMFGEHELGLEFGRLAARLTETGENRFFARACTTIGVAVAPRAFDPHTACTWLIRAREAADQCGDLVFAIACRHYLVVSLIGCGAPLEQAEREADSGVDYATRHRFQLAADRIRIVRALIRSLRDPAHEPGSLNDDQLNETAYERAIGPGLDRAYYWVRRLVARYFAGDFVGAREAARRTWELAISTPSAPYEIELWFFGALAVAACGDMSDPAGALEEMAGAERELLAWAERCPATFASKAALIGAERARLQGSDSEAERGFERAARLARQHRLIHEEALAHELSARFYAARGIASVARAKFSQARACYSKWGALGKVHALDVQLDGIEELLPAQSDALDRLDIKAVVSALQAISSSFELEELIQALMTTALQHAAAEHGLLVLLAGEPRIRGRASFQTTMIQVALDDAPLSPDSIPESIVRYVLRSGETVSTEEGEIPALFRSDSYFERRKVRSVLCMPILARREVVGALYLENTLSRQRHSPRGLAVLQLIASQAATSLENARLYAGIREAQQRMVRAERVSRTGSFSWRPQTQELVSSEELCNIYGIDGVPTIALLRERVHPDDRELFDAMASDTASFEGRTVEQRLVLPDGTLKHIAIIASRWEAHEYAGTVRDVTEAKLAEDALQRTQAALTDMARLGSMAEMAAAVAHEVNQPITGIVVNAGTCLRLLSDERGDVLAARNVMHRIQRDADRAAAVVRHLRALFSKTEGVKNPVDLNDAIAEVVTLSRSRIRAVGATMALELHADLPAALGDRVQLQQVVMNLLSNALDAMSAEPMPRILTIRTSLAEPGRLRCEFEDSGPGISEADQARIFEPFFTTKRHGMGIGLSICSNILTSHGGELSVARNGSRVGTTFYFVLPCGDVVPPAS